MLKPLSRLLPALVLPALAATSACAVTQDDSTSGESAATQRAALCEFPKRTHARPIADHYIVFADDAAREAYLEKFLPSIGKRRASDTSPLASLQASVDKLYPAMRAELPAETDGMTEPPRVVLLDDPLPNAFAASDGRESPVRAPWVFFVQTGLLQIGAGPNEIDGVIAHELAHLVAKHQFPDAPERVRRHYALAGREEGKVIPSLETDDDEVRAFANDFEGLVAFAGAFDAPALRGFPVKFSGITKPMRYHTLFTMLGGSPTPACAEASQRYGALQDQIRTHLSRFDNQLHLDADATKKMAPDVDATERSMRACATSANASLLGLAALFSAQTASPERLAQLQAADTPEALRDLVLDEDEKKVEARGGDVVTQLLALGRVKQQALSALVAGSKIPAGDMRRYAEEVEADQIAVRTLRRAKLDPTGGAGFLRLTLEETDRATCDASLAAGDVPPFGGFSFLHPAVCWRVWQAKAFAAALQRKCSR